MASRTLCPLIVGCALLGPWTVDARAQSASLFRRESLAPPPGVILAPPVRVDDISLVKLPPPPTYELHDLINIQVNETIINQTNARINKRRSIVYDYAVTDFILLLQGLRLRADDTIQTERPSAKIASLNQDQKQFQFNRNDILRYSLQAEVVEVRPNGTLVLEANGEVSVNNEVYQYRMSGVIDAKDVDPIERSVDSTRVAAKRLDLKQVGPTRDTLKRGFIAAFLDWFAPF